MRQEYMRRAIELAKRGLGRVNPNPLVGAVIVKETISLRKGIMHGMAICMRSEVLFLSLRILQKLLVQKCM